MKERRAAIKHTCQASTDRGEVNTSRTRDSAGGVAAVAVAVAGAAVVAAAATGGGEDVYFSLLPWLARVQRGQRLACHHLR